MEKTPTRKLRQSSGRYATQTIIERRPSSQHRTLIIGVHVCAGCAIPWIALPTAYLIVIGMLTLISLVFALKKTGRNTDSISLRRNGDMFLLTGDEYQWCHVEIASAFVAGWLIVLRFSGTERHKHKQLVCFPDSMLRDDFRRLRVFVHLHGPGRIRRSVEVTS